MSEDVQKRLEKVEASIAHLEHQVEQLNSVIVDQDKLLGQLKKQVQRQTTAMESMELEQMKANNPRPPHH